ncbi:hypothetical protein Taci_0032 [Thermanaerovibrio acidaminovorans DSM 6589]|uniref:DUF3298 domain-containing protein n=2 Tax=Thermanaerovibrio TaxID=81461 RepID=D1B7L9_THEAS|nr:hypothetical protein Taci_0032 [Thermanaerovibrio acidaminovorans DSM 6589]
MGMRTLKAVSLASVLVLLLCASALGAPRVSVVTLRRTLGDLRISVQYPRVETGGDPKVLLRMNRAFKEEAVRVLRQMEALAREAGDRGDPKLYRCERRVRVTFRRGNLFSFTAEQFVSLPNMAHPDSGLVGRTYDASTGEAVTLDRLFLPQWKQLVQDRVGRMAMDRIGSGKLEINQDQDIPSAEEYKDSFYLSRDRLVIYWERYRFTPGYVGVVAFEIPLRELRHLAREAAVRFH